MNHRDFFRVLFDVNAISEKEELLPVVKGATLGYCFIHFATLFVFSAFPFAHFKIRI